MRDEYRASLIGNYHRLTDSTFYVALDADNELTVYRMTDDLPKAVLRRCDLTAHTTDAWDVLTGHLEVFQ